MTNSIVRYAAWAAGIILALLALLAFSFVIRLYASLPQTSGRLELAGLRAEAQIVRDEHAVPHIFASNSHDAYYALGVAHAQDRLWQMEFQTHVAAGRLARRGRRPGGCVSNRRAPVGRSRHTRVPGCRA